MQSGAQEIIRLRQADKTAEEWVDDIRCHYSKTKHAGSEGEKKTHNVLYPNQLANDADDDEENCCFYMCGFLFVFYFFF